MSIADSSYVENMLTLGEILLPKESSNASVTAQQQYKGGLTAAIEAQHAGAGKKTYQRYKSCLLAAAAVVAESWEQFHMEDSVIFRKKNLKDQEHLTLEKAVLRIITRLNDVVKEGLIEERSQLGFDSAFRNGLFDYAESLISLTVRSQPSQSDLPPISYQKAKSQIEGIKTAIRILKEELDEMPNDSLTKPIKKALNPLFVTFLNHANVFLDERGRGKNA